MPDEPPSSDPTDDLLAEVAHELTNPLTIVQGFTTGLLEDGGLDDDQRHALTAIDRNVRLAMQLLSNYREAGRPGDDPMTLELDWVIVNELVEATVDDLASISRSHSITVERSEARIEVLADAGRLRQALFNLVANAVKHTPPGSDISVRTWRNDDGSVTIEVADQGDGVAPEIADRIFEPRTRGPDAPEGLGLGLYVSQRIAEAHGGSLELVPAEHGGAVFHLTLPEGRPGDDTGAPSS